jgi:AAA-like domain
MDQKPIELSPEDRQQFSEIFEAIGLTQTELAQLAEVSQSWLSQSVFTGYRPNANREMLERVVTVMTERLKSRQPDSRFSEERTQAAINFLGRFTATAANLINPSKVYPPGGIVPSDASYYIQRYADQQITEALQRLPITMVVRGPVQCGKSSLLARLEHKALEKGIKTAWFDPATITKAEHQADISANAAAALSKLLQERWRLTPPREDIWSITSLLNWLARALAPTASEPRLLILDDLVNLGSYGVEEWLRSFVREMTNKRAKGRGAQVSIAVGLAYHLGPDFAHRILEQSSVVAWWPRIDLNWFNFNETLELDEAIQEGSPLFSENSFVNVTTLISKLRGGGDALSSYLYDQITPETRKLLEQYTPPNQPEPHLIKALVNEINGLLEGASLYDEERFKEIELTEQTSILVEQNPQGKALVRLNRMLLEEAYPEEILGIKNLFELFGGQPYLTHAAAMDRDFLHVVQQWSKGELKANESFIQEHLSYRQHRAAIRSAILGPDWNVSEQTKNLLQAFATLESGSGKLSYDNEVFLGAAKLIKEADSFEQLKKSGSPKLVKEPDSHMGGESGSPKRLTTKLPIYRLVAKDFSKMFKG